MSTIITVACPHCGHKTRASTDHIGQRGRCPSCNAIVEITLPPTEFVAGAAMRPQAEVVGPASPDTAASTDVPTWLSGLIGLAATALLYLGVFLPLRKHYLGMLFLDRGSTPYFSVLVLCWGLAHLALKYLAVKRQQSYADLELELIPLKIGMQITPTNVDQFLNHLARLPAPQRRSILGRRIRGALEHFKGRSSVPEVQEFLSTQAGIDASGVDSGYALLRTFIWISPILGFIGTVIGISYAVTELKNAITPGNPLPATAAAEKSTLPQPTTPTDTSAKLMQGMQGVTGGLATAFDTTLVALVFAIFLVFPTESLRKSEYAMLDRIETFTSESLVRRMSDEKSTANQEDLPEIVRDTLKATFYEHQKWLAQWQAQVAELGQAIGADFERHVLRIQTQISEAEAARLAALQETGRMLSQVFGQFGEATQSWHDAENRNGASGASVIDAARQIEGSLTETARVAKDLLEQQQRAWQGYATSDLGANLLALQREIGRLSDHLATAPRATQVDESLIATDGHPSDKRRGLLGIFGR